MKGLLKKSYIILMAFCLGYVSTGLTMEYIKFKRPDLQESEGKSERKIDDRYTSKDKSEEKKEKFLSRDTQRTRNKTGMINRAKEKSNQFLNQRLLENQTVLEGIKLQTEKQQQMSYEENAQRQTILDEQSQASQQLIDKIKQSLDEASSSKMTSEGLFGPDFERSPTTTEERNNAAIQELDQEFETFKASEEAKINQKEELINNLERIKDIPDALENSIEDNYMDQFKEFYPDATSVTNQQAKDFLQKLNNQVSQLKEELPEKLSQKQQDIDWQKSEIQRNIGDIYTPTQEDQQQAMNRASRKANPKPQRALAERNRALAERNRAQAKVDEIKKELNEIGNRDYTDNLKRRGLTTEEITNKINKDKDKLEKQLNIAKDQLEEVDGTKAARQKAARKAAREAARQIAREAADEGANRSETTKRKINLAQAKIDEIKKELNEIGNRDYTNNLKRRGLTTEEITNKINKDKDKLEKQLNTAKDQLEEVDGTKAARQEDRQKAARQKAARQEAAREEAAREEAAREAARQEAARQKDINDRAERINQAIEESTSIVTKYFNDYEKTNRPLSEKAKNAWNLLKALVTGKYPDNTEVKNASKKVDKAIENNNPQETKKRFSFFRNLVDRIQKRFSKKPTRSSIFSDSKDTDEELNEILPTDADDNNQNRGADLQNQDDDNNNNNLQLNANEQDDDAKIVDRSEKTEESSEGIEPDGWKEEDLGEMSFDPPANNSAVLTKDQQRNADEDDSDNEENESEKNADEE